MLYSDLAQDIAVAVAKTQQMPIYLFAGQSNMQGNVDPTLFHDLLRILDSNQNHNSKQSNLEKTLNDWYLYANNGYARYAYSPPVSAMEAQKLLEFKKQGLITATFPNPPPTNNVAFCTCTDQAAKPMTDNCGNPFGPELLFSKKIAKTNHKPFTVVKVVEGGTSLAHDWISPSASNGNPGPMYVRLANRIASLKQAPETIHANCKLNGSACKFKAFVWFQGENDCFDQSSADAYANNLEHFISDVRTALGDPNFPVIIVQVGYWPKTLPFGPTVMKAQADFVNKTPNTALVTTVDLSQFYHFDPAAQLIIGARVANSVTKLAP